MSIFKKEIELGIYKDSEEWIRRNNNIKKLEELWLIQTQPEISEINQKNFAEFIGISFGFFRNMISARKKWSEKTLAKIEKNLGLASGELDRPNEQPPSYKPLLLECMKIAFEVIKEKNLDLESPTELVELLFESAIANKRVSKDDALRLISARKL